jgi:hypothetical protein
VPWYGTSRLPTTPAVSLGAAGCFGGVGLAAVKLLLWIALIMLALWVVGFFVRGAEGARWYRW